MKSPPHGERSAKRVETSDTLMGSFNLETKGEPALLAPDELLAKYERLLDCSRRMLELARLGQWEELLSEEARYVEDVQKLANIQPARALTQEEQQNRLSFMEQILECNLEVKRHLEMRRDEIGELINLSRRQGKLGRTYGVIDAVDKP